MSRDLIISLIKDFAASTAISPYERQCGLEDIEFAAQDQREKLEEKFDEDGCADGEKS